MSTRAGDDHPDSAARRSAYAGRSNCCRLLLCKGGPSMFSSLEEDSKKRQRPVSTESAADNENGFETMSSSKKAKLNRLDTAAWTVILEADPSKWRLSEIQLTNFLGWNTTIHLHPTKATLLVGPNGTGKTSIGARALAFWCKPAALPLLFLSEDCKVTLVFKNASYEHPFCVTRTRNTSSDYLYDEYFAERGDYLLHRIMQNGEPFILSGNTFAGATPDALSIQKMVPKFLRLIRVHQMLLNPWSFLDYIRGYTQQQRAVVIGNCFRQIRDSKPGWYEDNKFQESDLDTAEQSVQKYIANPLYKPFPDPTSTIWRYLNANISDLGQSPTDGLLANLAVLGILLMANYNTSAAILNLLTQLSRLQDCDSVARLFNTPSGLGLQPKISGVPTRDMYGRLLNPAEHESTRDLVLARNGNMAIPHVHVSNALDSLYALDVASLEKWAIFWALDEVDANLHPPAVRQFRAMLDEEAQTRAVLVVTHSPYMLKADDLENVFVCDKIKEKLNCVQLTSNIVPQGLQGVLSGNPILSELLFAEKVVLIPETRAVQAREVFQGKFQSDPHKLLDWSVLECKTIVKAEQIAKFASEIGKSYGVVWPTRRPEECNRDLFKEAEIFECPEVQPTHSLAKDEHEVTDAYGGRQ